jgi:hypothetical protein
MKHMSMPRTNQNGEAAREYCKDRGWSFKVLSENELGIARK